MIRKPVILVALAGLPLLPLAGLAGRGFPNGFFSFPPLVVSQPAHAGFSPPIFTVFAVLGILAAGLYLVPRRFGFAPPATPASARVESAPRPRFPAHGAGGLALMLGSWFVAWAPTGLPEAVGQHTFFPLWLGFILLMDGLVFRRTGRSLYATRRPVFLLLFPVSAVSWWYFEFLNRFVQNWWYPDRMNFGPVHYLLYSSLCFSTVLPAIFEVRDWLAGFPGLRRRHAGGPGLRVAGAGAGFAAAGALLLPLIGRFPEPLFFATWIAPLALLAGALALAGVATPFNGMKTGNWSPVLLLALAALVCGFFWELWNWHSSPRWAYAIPYVDRFPLFAMPVVGYAGYLPFGPVCACFWLAWTSLLPANIRNAAAAVLDLPGPGAPLPAPKAPPP